jgi:hypothetical protein
VTGKYPSENFGNQDPIGEAETQKTPFCKRTVLYILAWHNESSLQHKRRRREGRKARSSARRGGEYNEAIGKTTTRPLSDEEATTRRLTMTKRPPRRGGKAGWMVEEELPVNEAFRRRGGRRAGGSMAVLPWCILVIPFATRGLGRWRKRNQQSASDSLDEELTDASLWRQERGAGYPCTFPCIPVLFPTFWRYSCIKRLAHGSTPVPRD